MNKFLDIAPEVKEAIYNNRPVVALESAIIFHDIPYPKNVETALKVEKIIRANGAVPAMTAVIDGRLKCGLSADEIEYVGKQGQNLVKCSRKDIPVVISKKLDGVTTIGTAMIIAKMAEVGIFATGGIGGVHRNAEMTIDISADLEELGQTPVMVVCAGGEGILDIGLTLEYLETKGVPVIGYGTDHLGGCYTRESGFPVDYRLDTPKELAEAFQAQRGAGLQTGMIVTNPISEEESMDADEIEGMIDRVVEEAEEKEIHGEGIIDDRLEVNIQPIYNNAKVAAQVAVELCALY